VTTHPAWQPHANPVARAGAGPAGRHRRVPAVAGHASGPATRPGRVPRARAGEAAA